MDQIRNYLIAVTAGAIICAIAKSVSDEKTVPGAMIRLIAGIIMTLVILSPVVQLDLVEVPRLTADITAEARSAVAMGEEMASAEINAIITESVRAYILDKAAELGASLEAEIELAEDGTYQPVRISLWGKVTPYARARLQNIIEEHIHIAKEKQQWIS